MVDDGWLCSGIISDEITNQLSLPRFPIHPRPLRTVEDSTLNKPIVQSITHISLDLDGHLTPKLWLYVVPHSTHQLILGKKWLEDQDAVLHAKEQRLELRKKGGSVYSVKRWRDALRNIPRLRVATAAKITSLIKEVPVAKASLEDINKALRSKPIVTEDSVRNRLPEQVKEFAHLFADGKSAEDLPPLRGSSDHAINVIG